MVRASEGRHPNDTNHISLRTMTFTFSFNSQSKPVQKIDWDASKEISLEKIKQVESIDKLEFKQFAERASDDLTGASYRSDNEEWVLCGDLLMPPDLCDKKDEDSSGGNDGNNGGGGGGSSDTTPNDFDGTSGDAPMPPSNAVNGSNEEQALGGYSSSSPNDGVDPTDPTNGGCGDDYDYRPNPEEYKDYGSLSAVNLKDMSSSSAVDLVLHAMSVDTMGM